MIKYKHKETGAIYVKHNKMNYIVSNEGMYSADNLGDKFEMIVDDTSDDDFCHLSDEDFTKMIGGWLQGTWRWQSDGDVV